MSLLLFIFLLKQCLFPVSFLFFLSSLSPSLLLLPFPFLSFTSFFLLSFLSFPLFPFLSPSFPSQFFLPIPIFSILGGSLPHWLRPCFWWLSDCPYNNSLQVDGKRNYLIDFVEFQCFQKTKITFLMKMYYNNNLIYDCVHIYTYWQ